MSLYTKQIMKEYTQEINKAHWALDPTLYDILVKVLDRFFMIRS